MISTKKISTIFIDAGVKSRTLFTQQEKETIQILSKEDRAITEIASILKRQYLLLEIMFIVFIKNHLEILNL